MAAPITLTQQPIRVTATGFQPIDLAVDIGMFDALDMELGVTGLEGASPTITVELWTGMQNKTTDGWVQLPQATTFNTPNTRSQQLLGPDGLLRHISWSGPTLTNSGFIGFSIRASCHRRALAQMP